MVAELGTHPVGSSSSRTAFLSEASTTAPTTCGDKNKARENHPRNGSRQNKQKEGHTQDGQVKAPNGEEAGRSSLTPAWELRPSPHFVKVCATRIG